MGSINDEEKKKKPRQGAVGHGNRMDKAGEKEGRTRKKGGVTIQSRMEAGISETRTQNSKKNKNKKGEKQTGVRGKVVEGGGGRKKEPKKRRGKDAFPRKGVSGIKGGETGKKGEGDAQKKKKGGDKERDKIRPSNKKNKIVKEPRTKAEKKGGGKKKKKPEKQRLESKQRRRLAGKLDKQLLTARGKDRGKRVKK